MLLGLCYDWEWAVSYILVTVCSFSPKRLTTTFPFPSLIPPPTPSDAENDDGQDEDDLALVNNEVRLLGNIMLFIR